MPTMHSLMPEVTNEHLQPVADLIQQLHAAGRITCACRECLLDIAAIALNTLPPRYTVSLVKDLWVTAEQEKASRVQLEAAVAVACARVRERPHHD